MESNIFQLLVLGTMLILQQTGASLSTEVHNCSSTPSCSNESQKRRYDHLALKKKCAQLLNAYEKLKAYENKSPKFFYITGDTGQFIFAKNPETGHALGELCIYENTKTAQLFFLYQNPIRGQEEISRVKEGKITPFKWHLLKDVQEKKRALEQRRAAIERANSCLEFSMESFINDATIIVCNASHQHETKVTGFCSIGLFPNGKINIVSECTEKKEHHQNLAIKLAAKELFKNKENYGIIFNNSAIKIKKFQFRNSAVLLKYLVGSIQKEREIEKYRDSKKILIYFLDLVALYFAVKAKKGIIISIETTLENLLKLENLPESLDEIKKIATKDDCSKLKLVYSLLREKGFDRSELAEEFEELAEKVARLKNNTTGTIENDDALSSAEESSSGEQAVDEERQVGAEDVAAEEAQIVPQHPVAEEVQVSEKQILSE